MDWMVLIPLVISLIALAVHVVTRRTPAKSEEEAFVEKWDLPNPGGDFRLYRKVKKLLDDLESERNEARLERDVARRAYEGALEEQRRLASKLEAAQSMLRQWTHPKMKIIYTEKPNGRRQVQRIL